MSSTEPIILRDHLTFQCEEPTVMDYGYFDEMDRFHWLLPLIGGDTIGLDNTCKTMLELQTFFNGDSHAKPPRLSALTVLMNYQEHLKNDIDKLIMSVPSGHLLLVTKKKRLRQIQGHIELSPHLKAQFDSAQSGITFGDFPKQIHDLLAKSNSNCKAMHLSPETPDRFVKTKSPAFLLKSAASVDGFVHTLKSTLPPPMAVPSKLLVEVLSAFGEGPWEGVSEETLLDRLLALIKEKLIKLYGEDVKDIDLYQTQIREEPEEPPRFKRMTVDLLKQILFEDSLPFNTVEGRKEIVNNLIANADIEVGFFQRKESELKFNETILSGVETEKRSIGIQFFLATIALYCRAHGLSNKNFGEVIDSNREKLSQSIKEAIEQKKPVDQVLFNFIETHLEALGLESLTVEQQTTIKAQFFNQWETIKDSPHFDEFLVFFPEIQGDVFNHRGRLSVSALDVVLRSDDVNSIISTYGLDGQSEALKAAAERKLPRSNQALSKRSFDTLLGEHAVTYPMLRHLKGDWWVNPASINKLLSLGLPPEKYTSNRMDWLNTLSPEAFDEKLGELMRRETFDGSLLSLDILKSIIALLNKPGLSPQATSGLDKLLAKRGRSYDRLNTLDKDELKAVLEAFPPEGQHLIHLILPTPKDLAYFINGCESMEKLSVFQQTFFESLGPKELIDLIKHLEPTQCGKAVELMRWMRPEASLSILFENNFLEKIEANRGQAFFDAAGNLTKDYLLSLTPEARIGICSDAVSFGYVYLMEQCFNQGVSPNALYKGRRLTSIAVEKNQGKCLQRLLNEGALWVKESPSLPSLLEQALLVGSMDVIQPLLQVGATLDCTEFSRISETERCLGNLEQAVQWGLRLRLEEFSSLEPWNYSIYKQYLLNNPELYQKCNDLPMAWWCDKHLVKLRSIPLRHYTKDVLQFLKDISPDDLTDNFLQVLQRTSLPIRHIPLIMRFLFFPQKSTYPIGLLDYLERYPNIYQYMGIKDLFKEQLCNFKKPSEDVRTSYVSPDILIKIGTNMRTCSEVAKAGFQKICDHLYDPVAAILSLTDEEMAAVFDANKGLFRSLLAEKDDLQACLNDCPDAKLSSLLSMMMSDGQALRLLEQLEGVDFPEEQSTRIYREINKILNLDNSESLKDHFLSILDKPVQSFQKYLPSLETQLTQFIKSYQAPAEFVRKAFLSSLDAPHVNYETLLIKVCTVIDMGKLGSMFGLIARSHKLHFLVDTLIDRVFAERPKEKQSAEIWSILSDLRDIGPCNEEVSPQRTDALIDWMNLPQRTDALIAWMRSDEKPGLKQFEDVLMGCENDPSRLNSEWDILYAQCKGMILKIHTCGFTDVEDDLQEILIQTPDRDTSALSLYILELEALRDVSEYLREKINDYKTRNPIANSPSQRKAQALEKAVNDIPIRQRSKISSKSQTIVQALNLSTEGLSNPFRDKPSAVAFKKRFKEVREPAPSGGGGPDPKVL